MTDDSRGWLSRALDEPFSSVLALVGLATVFLGLFDVEDLWAADVEVRDPMPIAVVVSGAAMVAAAVTAVPALESRRRRPARGTDSGEAVRPPPHVEVPEDLDADFIRVSISALCRVKCDGRYLLVRGRRIDQYQPVGGVLKRLSLSAPDLGALGVRDDASIPIDSSNANDLRVRVPTRNLQGFMAWYAEQRGRELGPWREFWEELVARQDDDTDPILDADTFPYVKFQWIGQHVTDLHYSVHFQCHEVLIAELFEPDFTAQQYLALRRLMARRDPRFVWVTAKEIETRGVAASHVDGRVAETAAWLL